MMLTAIWFVCLSALAAYWGNRCFASTAYAKRFPDDGNRPAYAFFAALFAVATIWDDVVAPCFVWLNARLHTPDAGLLPALTAFLLTFAGVALYVIVITTGWYHLSNVRRRVHQYTRCKEIAAVSTARLLERARQASTPGPRDND